MYVCTLGTFKSLPRSQSSPFPLPPFSKGKALETRLFESKMAAPLPTLRSLTETENSRPLFQRFQPLIYDCTSPLSYF